MPYRSPVTAPSTRCTLRSVVLVLLPPALTEVIRVASRGPWVIGPILCGIFSIGVRLSSKACCAAFAWVSVLEKPRSSREGSVLAGDGLGDGGFGRFSAGAGNTEVKVRLRVCWLAAVRVTLATAAPIPSAEAETSYSPGERLGTVYRPAESVCVSVDWPVDEFFTVTLALGRTLPEESLTVPESVDGASCAKSGLAASTKISTPQKKKFDVFGIIRASSFCVTILIENFMFQRCFCQRQGDRKSTRLNSSHLGISYA